MPAEPSEAAEGEPSGAKPAGWLATEKPVPSGSGVTEYVVSVEDATGAVTKIERLDPGTGERRELTPGEYARMSRGGPPAAGGRAPRAAAPYSAAAAPAAHGAAAQEAHFKAVVDYLKAITGIR